MRRLFILSLFFASFGLLTACDDVPDISLPNEPVVAVDDDILLLQDFTATFDVTANDSDIDGDIIDVSLTSETSNGTITVLTSGEVQYTPNRLFEGTDSFSYSITDIAGFTDEATVTLNVVKRQLRVLMTTDSANPVRGGSVLRRLYLLDTRTPGSAIELSSELEAGESIKDWTFSAVSQAAILLTDANRVVLIDIDQTSDTRFFDIELDQGQVVDSGIDALPNGVVAFSINNQFLRLLNLTSGQTQTVDTGFTDSTMEVDFFTPVGTGVIMRGTLAGSAAVYLVPVSGSPPVQIIDEPGTTEQPRTRLFPVVNAMISLLEQPGTPESGGLNCSAPPQQRLSNLFYTSLLQPTIRADLNTDSLFFGASDETISNSFANATAAAYIAACIGNSEIVQIVEVPFVSPTNARQIGTTTDSSDLLYSVDVAPGGAQVIFTLAGDTGARAIAVDLSDTDTDPVTTDISSMLPGFQAYTAGGEQRLPQSVFSDDGLFWLYLAAVDDQPTRLSWLDPESETVASADLPFAAESPASDGYFGVLAQSGASETEVALVDLQTGQVNAITVPGLLPVSNQALALSPIVLAPIPVTDIN